MSSQAKSHQEEQLQAEPDNLPCEPGEHLSWRRYERTTGGMPIGAYILAGFYSTAVILLACAPWNFLLILGLLLSKDDVLRFWISSRWGRAS
jgi:hypothetical protein